MESAPSSGGGLETHRGLEHERAAAIYHLLIRMAQYRSARVTIESEEDATITWFDPTGRKIVEDIQCKKIEKIDGPASLGMQDWRPGPLTKDKFAHYLTEVRRGQSTLDRLQQPDRFFTLLAYAREARATEKYIPPGVVEASLAGGPAAPEYFPLDFAFPEDPDPNSALGTSTERQKIRVVFQGPPKLRSESYILLHKFYGVSGGKTSDALVALEARLYGHLERDPEARTLGRADIETALRPYVAGMGKWVDVETLIATERDLLPGHEQQRDLPIVTWSDFDAGHFIQTALIRQGAEAFDRHGFLAVSGYHGGGKTVLCKYLAHRFLNANPGGKCFYLQTEPADQMRDELDAFEARLAEPFLFIIDDAHFAQEQVATIARAYVDSRMGRSPSARLVIATTDTSLSAARRAAGRNPLDEAEVVRFDLFGADEIAGYLASYRSYRGLPEADDSNLISLAEDDQGQVSLATALVLLHAADPELLSSATALAFGSPRVRDAVGKWLAGLVQLPAAKFETLLAPVLTICSLGLPLRPEFSEGMDRLIAAGFLVADAAEQETLYRIRPEYASLAWIVSRQHLREHRKFFADYLRLHNTQVPRLAQALCSDYAGRDTLVFLLRNHLEWFVPADRSRGPDLSALASTLAAVRRVREDCASGLLRLCFHERHGGYAPMSLQSSVFAALGFDARPATAFLDATRLVDRVFARRVGELIIGDAGDLYILLQLVCSSPSNLEDLLNFLRAGKSCDLRFGTEICPAFVEDPAFERKWGELRAADNPTGVVRSLATLSLVNRRVFAQTRDTHLTEALVEKWIAKVHDVVGFVDFLTGVRRLSPRISSRALKLLMERHKGLLASLIRNAPDLGGSSAVIASVGRIDRRVAITLFRDHFNDLARQVSQEKSYRKLGESLGRLSRGATTLLSGDLAAFTNVDAIAQDMGGEKRRFDLIGRSLSQVASLHIDIAEAIAQRLDYLAIYSRIHERVLMNLAQLTRGLLHSLPEEQRAKLLSDIHRKAGLATLFHNAFTRETALHRIADALSALASAQLRASQIFRLLGTDEEGFRDLIDQRVRGIHSGRHSDLELANLLFALAQMGPVYAAAALVSCVDTIADPERPLRTPEGGAQGGVNLQSRVTKRFKKEGGRRPYFDVAGTGALLHVASLIDDQSARRLIGARRRAFAGTRSDPDLGRHAVLLLGTYNASRTECLSFLRTIYTDDQLAASVDLAHNPRELIQFLYAVQTVSLGESKRIASSMLAGGTVSLRDYLESEVDLGELARWAMSIAAVGQLPTLDVGAIATECAEYDTRLWALIDAAQAMITVGMADSAAVFASKILEQVKQARGIRKLSHAIQLWLKASYVARELRQPRVLTDFAEALLPAALRLVALEDDHICTAFAIRLWLDGDYLTTSQRDQLGEYSRLQILRCSLEGPSPASDALAATLLQAPQQELERIVTRIEGTEWAPWVWGLLRLFGEAYGREISPPANAPRSIDLHQNNLKFALACYEKRRAHGSLSSEEEKELSIRHGDESSAAVRHLLTTTWSGAAMAAHPYYLWVYLRRTVLALNYLDWEAEVHRASSAVEFGKGFMIDANPLLAAAE